jgi:hypothetical protein
MTQSTTNTANDPWAAAQVTQPAQPGQEQGGQQGSSLAGSYTQPQAGPSKLFQQAGAAPSLFNKTHYLGTERTGIITKAPFDQQQQDYNEKKPKYWSTSKVGGKAFTTEPIDAPTGQLNRPAMGTHIELATDYRMTAQEITAVGGNRDVSFANTDNGKRVYVASNKYEYDAFRKAIVTAIAAGIPITEDEDLVGLRLTVKRTRQQPNPGGNPSWDPDISLTRP